MSAIELMHQPAAQAISWALLQFVWQGALIGALTATALAALRRGAADVRYVVATIGLTLMLTMPIVTGVQSWRNATIPNHPAMALTSDMRPDPSPTGSRLLSRGYSGRQSVTPA